MANMYRHEQHRVSVWLRRKMRPRVAVIIIVVLVRVGVPAVVLLVSAVAMVVRGLASVVVRVQPGLETLRVHQRLRGRGECPATSS